MIKTLSSSLAVFQAIHFSIVRVREPDQADINPVAKTCALVGNAGVNLMSRFGEGIDSHEVVIRFNNGPTQRFESHVGRRTTFRLINNLWSTHLTTRTSPLHGTQVGTQALR